MMPGTPAGPIVAHTLALLPLLSGTRSCATPHRSSQASTHSTSGRFELRLVVSKPTRASSTSMVRCARTVSSHPPVFKRILPEEIRANHETSPRSGRQAKAGKQLGLITLLLVPAWL